MRNLRPWLEVVKGDGVVVGIVEAQARWMAREVRPKVAAVCSRYGFRVREVRP